MATVFMRWLERRPATYDRGIRLLTLGRLDSLYGIIADRVHPGQAVLEIGCGTGALTARLAQRGGRIDAIDVSADMINATRDKLKEAGLLKRVKLTRLDALALEAHFEPDTFDLIVSSLAFSEFSLPAQEHVLRLCRRLLKPDGAVVILDEVQPDSLTGRVLTSLIRGPLKLITWLLTRTTTSPLTEVGRKLNRAGFQGGRIAHAPGASLGLYMAKPIGTFSPDQLHHQIPRLKHRPTLASLLRDLWALFFRVLPPYPKFGPGLYAVGNPGVDHPVLVTGNYDLTVRRVVRDLDGRVDAWLLVVDSSGVNVWCGAGGGFLNAERVIGAWKMSGLDEWHAGRRMVLPQLCANGVDGNLIRGQTGWQVRWGPVEADDIPRYLAADCEKTEAMRTVSFPVLRRLEMVSATLGLYGLMILIPIFLFWRNLFWPTLFALLGLSYFYALALPLIPGRDGLIKSVPLALIALIGLIGYSWISGFPEAQQIFRSFIGLTALSVFVAAEMQGMSPLMRGEQANWGWEVVIGVLLAAIYWLVPLFMGWSA
jgi:ubiquinone/menaquinone biosynthesis C-methylase UbiE